MATIARLMPEFWICIGWYFFGAIVGIITYKLIWERKK